jgi:hypothetical protein
MNTGLLEKGTTRIYFDKKIDLIGFLDEWFGFGLAKHFQVTIITPDAAEEKSKPYLVQDSYIVQLISKDGTQEQYSEHLDMLDRWIEKPSHSIRGWKWVILEIFER